MVRLTVICIFVIFLVILQHSFVESKSSKKASKKSSHKSSHSSSDSSSNVPDDKLAACPECEEYGVLTCELRGCDQESDLVDEIPDSSITATSFLSTLDHGTYGPERSRLISRDNSDYPWQPTTASSNEYLQFEFPDMKIVQAIVTVKTNSYSYVTSYNVTTSTDCSAFTSALPIIDVGDKDNVTSTFPCPVSARCVRVHAANWTMNTINMKIGLLGCKAE